MNKYISIQDIHKRYGKKDVLKGISLDIDKGEFWGIFGKNGAGKTTLFKILLGLVSPSSGNIYFDGITVKKMKHLSIGYLPENISLYGHLSVADNLKVAALSAGFTLNSKNIFNILESVNLNTTKTLAKDLSLGMKRRLQFAMATMTKPTDILILDEPTNGMDVNGVLWLKDYIDKERKEGRTILICSHSLNLMEDMVDHYCVINDGRIVKSESWNTEQQKLYLLTFNAISDYDLRVISQLGNVKEIDQQKISLMSDFKLIDVVKFLIDHNLDPDNIVPVKESLEKIYIESVAENVESSMGRLDQN